MKIKDIVKYVSIYLGDFLSILGGFLLALLLSGKVRETLGTGHRMAAYALIFWVFFNILFFAVKYYRDSIFNFDSFAAITLGLSVFLVYTAFYAFTVLTVIGISLSVWIVALILSCFLCGSYRILAIAGRKLLLRYVKRNGGDEKNVIIMGAGEAGKFLADLLAYDRDKRMKVVAFIDDNPKLHGRRVKGYPVAGGRASISDAVKKYKAEEIIIAIPHVDNSNFREIVGLCCASGCKVRRFANMSDLNMTDLSKATINEVNIEDLLGREPVKLDLTDVREMLKDKTVLVTGGAGSIGSEICRQLLSYQVAKVVLYDINENGLFFIGNELSKKHAGRFVTVIGNIRDQSRLESVMQSSAPQIVFHAAAYKHVPMMERNPIEAVANNVFGTENVMRAAIAHHVESFILISTDKAVNPSSVMGATKRIAELLCKYMNSRGGGTKFSAVRFGNVLGSNGSVIPIFKEQIRKGGPVTVTDRNIQRYFMTIPEAVQLVLEAASLSKGGELFVLDMGEMIRIYDLATTMIRLSGLEPEKDIKIEICGLRPGEKLYEELQMNTEKLSRTANNRIFVFRSDKLDPERFVRELDALSAGYESDDMECIFRQIKALIPTYARSSYISRIYFPGEPGGTPNPDRSAEEEPEKDLAAPQRI